MHSRHRIAAIAILGLVAAVFVPTTSASAAPTRYEAETAPAVCNGTIDSNWPGFSGTGFCNATNAVASFAEWTVNAANAGTATIAIRYANGTTTGRPSDILVNGTVVQAASAFDPTGAWSTWATKTLTAQVNAGSNTIRVAGTTATGPANLDFIDFEVAPPQNFTDYQAENATISQGLVESNHLGFTGTGFVNYDNLVGSYVEFTVNAASAGNYPLTFRFSNGTTTDRPMDITVNGQPAAPGLSFPSTTNWDNWAEKNITANLAAGANKIRATATTANGGPNLDRLRATVPSDTQPPTAPANLHVVGEVRPFDVDLAWDPATDNVGVDNYKIYNGGNVLKVVGGNITATRLMNLTPNTTYVLTVLAYDATGNNSPASNNLQITTPPSNDTEPPTVPANLHATNVGATSVTLAWNASTDNIGVTGYRVFRNGTQFADVPDLTATDTGLTPDTTYNYTALAYDANNNTSAQSTAVPVKTLPQGGGGDPAFDRNVNTQMDLPWGIGFLPDGAALVNERDRFEVVKVTLSGQKTVLGRITEAVTTTGEGGLLGLAVSPTFATDNYVYVYYTSSSDNRVARFKLINDVIGAREPIVTGIAKSTFHNGGRLKFGPDGFLYITTGDAQDSSRAQNLNSLNGKILRVTPTGAPAPGNPFGTRIYSYGHRNVQGIAWDSQGRLWASEFGNSTWDELNRIQSGGNYGWPTCEGSCSTAGMINPVRQWDVASASPSGLEIVNDWIYMAAVRGSRLWVMKITGANSTDTPRAFFNGTWGRLRTVVKTPDGGLWLTSTNNDKNGGTPNTLDNVIVRLKFALTLSSSAFNNGAAIPTKYTCAQDHASGNDISPPLAWSGDAGTGVQSYAITLIDTTNGNKHYVIWDIPASRSSLPEGLGLGFNVPNQSPAKQRSFGTGTKTYQFFGPCPGGSTHTYQFKLYALNVATLPGVDANSTVAQVETAILANDISSATLNGTSNAAV
jgi:Raf kinase inhibitor-like YbhB/YbcL family protein